MAFFQQLIADLEHSPRQRDVQPLGGDSRRNTESAAITQHAIDVPKEVVCTENLNPNVMVMKSAKDGVRFDVSGPLNRARDRGIFIQ
jgi:hypothetical protein